jgi:hypothetical protein
MVFRKRFLVILLALVGTLAGSGQTLNPPKPASPPSTPPERKAAKAPWDRIVVVGASASAGFVESEPLGGPNTARHYLSRYVDAALLAPHEPVRNLASTMFFLQPEVLGRQQINQALKAGPTLVVGLDFLFWFCYGEMSADAERLRRFEKGLTMLEAIESPLVVGDIPDASGAADDMLAPEQIPSAQVMASANRRLREWAATRSHVTVVPLSKFMRAAMANQAFTVHGQTLLEGQTQALLQRDRLHPSPLGCAVLALSVLEAGLSTGPAAGAADIRWNRSEVLRLAAGGSLRR